MIQIIKTCKYISSNEELIKIKKFNEKIKKLKVKIIH